MENLEILISESFFSGLAFLKKARPNINSSISLFLIIIDSLSVLQKLLGLADLARAQTFHIYELTKVVIVSEDKDLVFATFQIVAPSLKSLNNS